MSESNLEQEQVGPFQIIRRLGNKRQRVFEASQTEQNRKVALKFIALPPDVSRDHALRKIQKEVRFLQRLSHPNLVQFYGAGVANDRVFFAMELVEGEPLSAIMSRRGRIAWDLAVQYAIQISDVLNYLHSKDLLHSKLTPEKILVANGQIKLTDLRMNRARRRRWDAKKREELEVAAYLAPEQLLGEGATAQSDLYSLGTILYEMITGKMPYPPESLERMAMRKKQQPIEAPSHLAVDCPVWLDKVIETLMNPDPRKRYLSAHAARLALVEVQTIDANKTSTAAQLTSGFTALTAGVDKTEARKVLGKKEPLTEKQLEKKRKKEAIPFYLQTWLLILGLVCASAAIGGAIYMITPSVNSALVEANRILDDEDAGILAIRNSERKLQSMIDRNPDSEKIDEMQQAIEALQVKRLLRLAKRGHVGLQEPNTKLFIQAYQSAVNSEFRESLSTYRDLLRQVPLDDPEQGFMSREAVRQMDSVRKRFAENVGLKLAEHQTLEQDKEALQLAVAIKQELGNDPQFQDWIMELETQYPSLQQFKSLPVPTLEMGVAAAVSESDADTDILNDDDADEPANASETAGSEQPETPNKSPDADEESETELNRDAEGEAGKVDAESAR